MDDLFYKYLIPDGIFIINAASFHLLYRKIHKLWKYNIICHCLSIDPFRDQIFIAIISSRMSLNPVRDVI